MKNKTISKLDFEKEINKYKEALIWCGGSADFGEGGIARVGWLKICEPLLRNKHKKEI